MFFCQFENKLSFGEFFPKKNKRPNMLNIDKGSNGVYYWACCLLCKITNLVECKNTLKNIFK